jgi:hypothetical protein
MMMMPTSNHPGRGGLAQPWPPYVRVREVFDLPGITVAAGCDGDRTYLLVPVTDRGDSYCICAPASERAIDCVKSRRTSPWEVVHHSATGMIEVWRRDADGSMIDSTVPCAQVRLPAAPAA